MPRCNLINKAELIAKLLETRRQTQLAAQVGVSRPTISDWKKRGTVPAPVAFVLENLLNERKEDRNNNNKIIDLDSNPNYLLKMTIDGRNIVLTPDMVKHFYNNR